jgi:hypothetical protein
MPIRSVGNAPPVAWQTAYDSDMKKANLVAAFVVGLGIASLPYTLFGGNATAQDLQTPLPPSQMRMQPQGPPQITAITESNGYLYVGAGNWLYKVEQSGLTVVNKISINPPQRAARSQGDRNGLYNK